ncbi:C2 domain-containing protein 2-like isoform 5-T8 [Clarias gariepinus]
MVFSRQSSACITSPASEHHLDVSHLEPSEVRTWLPPTPAPAKRVKMDRTVMPCGTVVTTVTAVRSRPGRPLHTESMRTPPRSKLTERRVSEQPSVLGAKVSNALSYRAQPVSDTDF